MFDIPEIPSFAPPDADRPVPTELMGKIAVQEELALSAEELQGKGSKDAIIGMWAEKNAPLFAEFLQNPENHELIIAQGTQQDPMRFERIKVLWEAFLKQKKAIEQAKQEAEEQQRQQAQRPNTW